MSKNNITSEMQKYVFPIKERIFDHQYEYAVVTRISDVWFNSNNELCLETTLSNMQKAILKIKVLVNGVINIKYGQKQWSDNRFSNHLNNLQQETLNIDYDGNLIVINLKNKEKLLINKTNAIIKLLDSEGVVKMALNDRVGYKMFANYINPPLGFKIKANDVALPFISLWLHNDEKIYGLGEKFRPLVKNGIESVVWNTDNSCVANHDLSYSGLPLIYSTKKWGMLANTGHKTTWEIGSPTTDAISLMSEENVLDLYLFTGDSMKSLITQYTELTGKNSRSPDIGYGLWLNRLYYHNREELFKEIANAKKHNVALDIITLDPKWLKDRYVKSCNFEFNTDAFGDPESLMNDVNDEGLKMCFWINPYVQSDNGPNWNYLLSNDLLVKSVNGGYAHPYTGTEVYQTNNYLVDFTNKKAFDWYKEQIKKLFSYGLRFVKPDYGDGVPEDAIFSNGQTGLEMGQYYHYLYCQVAYEASTEYFGEGQGIVLCRPGYIGTQRFTGKWSGDSYANFNEIKTHLSAGLSLGMAGDYFWGTDIGGFSGKTTKDLYMRWTQFGLMCPLSRYHGIEPREPWYFDGDVLANTIKFVNLKKSLLPYFKQCEEEAVNYGWPIMRAMVLENEADFIAQTIDNQYYLGSSLLLAPILTENTLSRQVYLPAGQWYLLDQKETVYEGNKLYTFKCASDEMLIFVKANTVLVRIKELGYNFSDLDKVTLVTDVYGNSGSGTYYFMLNDKKYSLTYNLEKNDLRLKLIAK